MYHVKSKKKWDFVDIFEFFSTFWNLINFQPRWFSLNLRKLLILLILIFCFVNWTYVPCRNEQKVWFWRSFRIFLYILKLYSFSASQIFTKLQKIVVLPIYILPCKLDLCTTWNRIKSMILSIFFEFSSTFLNLIHFWSRKFSQNIRKLLILSIFIFCLVNWTYVPWGIEQNVILSIFLNIPVYSGA